MTGRLDDWTTGQSGEVKQETRKMRRDAEGSREGSSSTNILPVATAGLHVPVPQLPD